MLVVYISHRLAEVRHVADRITVFRNGATVAAHDTASVSDDEIIAEMLGRRMDRLYPDRGSTTATERLALKVRDLSVGDRLAGVDLDLREGEVLGVGGLQGHGQRELFQALFGIGRAKGDDRAVGQADDGPRPAPGADRPRRRSRWCRRTAGGRGCFCRRACART